LATLAAILGAAFTSRARLVAAVLGLAISVLAGCGGGGGATTTRSGRVKPKRVYTYSARHRPAAVGVRLSYRHLYTLPAPLRDPAYAPLGGDRFAMLGGLDSADVSADGVEIADLHGVLHTSTLPGAQHDAQAALLAGDVYVFGGGSTTELDHILRYDPASGAVSQVGTLLAAQSDVAVTQWSGTAYVVGGYDGTTYLNTVVAWRPGSGPQIEGRLPVGLRYAAVAIANGGLFVLGGSTPSGASDAIYRFDLTTHQVRQVGTLAHPVTHGEAATLGAHVYLIGGRGDNLTAQTAGVWAIDPSTGKVQAAGHLPQPTSDAAALTIGHAIVVAGGQSPNGTLGGVGELVPAG
jgi:N-acetylneuraminic acid mutarotase